MEISEVCILLHKVQFCVAPMSTSLYVISFWGTLLWATIYFLLNTFLELLRNLFQLLSTFLKLFYSLFVL